MPLMNVIAIAVVGISAYLWMLRGFFSAFINLVCVVAAGAIALALWEPLSYWLLAQGGGKGFFPELLASSAWALGLALPFVASLAILRGTIDSIIRMNLHMNSTANYVGGGLCGGLAGVILSGFACISFGMQKAAWDLGDYNPVSISASGAVQKGSGLWVPADKMTSWFYSMASTRVFASSTPLATWYPDFYTTPGLLRYTAKGGTGNVSLRPGVVSVKMSYTVEPTSTGKDRLNEMLKDKWTAPQPGVTDFDGENVSANSKLYGYVLGFAAGAKEKNGQVVVGNAQVRIVAENESGETRLIFPNAVVCKVQPPAEDPNSTNKNKKKNQVEYARFAFGSGGEGKYFFSVGADAEALFGFEFIVPNGWTPKTMYVRNTRIDIPAVSAANNYASAAARDNAIASGSFVGGGTIKNLDESLAVVAGDTKAVDRSSDTVPENIGFQVSFMLGMILQKDTIQGCEFIGLPRAGWAIRDGEAKITTADVSAARGVDANLKVDRFEPVENQVVVQVDVSMNQPWHVGERGFDNTGRIFLVDDTGKTFDCIGYVYKDQDFVGIRYTPGSPMKSLSDLPKTLSLSEPGQTCKLVFRISNGVTIKGLGIGDKLAIKYGPKLHVVANQKL